MYCYQYVTHTIRPGDTLYQLAEYYHTSVQSIMGLNPNLNPYNLMMNTDIILCPGDGETGSQGEYEEEYQYGQTVLDDDMRKAWEQHVYWVRMLLISIAEMLGDEEATSNRVLRNPADIAVIFARFYGDDMADAIRGLLREHLQIGASLITALRDGDTVQAEALNQRWYANADAMSDLFGSLNPYYNRDEVRDMLHRHLDLTSNMVGLRLAGNYPADIEAFDAVEREALMMADYFTEGLIRQFPDEFV